MEVVITQNYKQLCKLAALLIKEFLAQKPKAKLSIATGKTMIGVYEELIKNKADFSKARFFGLDEYCNTTKSESMYSFIYKRLYSKKGVRKKQIFFPNGNAGDLTRECKDYETKFAKMDLTILGIGKNAHIAFNEPGTNFNSKTHIAKLTKSTIKTNKLKNINHAITVGLSTIMQSKKIILLVSGQGKRKAVHRMLRKISKQVPASILQKHKNTLVIADEEAYRK